MTNAFQTAVSRTVPHRQRLTAIDRLADADEHVALQTIVLTGGLDGRYRRRALDRLADCGAREALETLANDGTIERTLRRRARRRLQ